MTLPKVLPTCDMAEDGDDGWKAAFADLKALTEARDAGRAKLNVNSYEGPGGIKVVCQEAFHHNFDLTHEHWAEVMAPGDEAVFGGEVYRGSEENVLLMQVLLTGDKAAGKTTFLNGLTTGELQVLQCLRYDSGLFYNIWYAPGVRDLEELRNSIARRSLPFYQTELAHGGMIMEAGELRFFMEDDEFDEGFGISSHVNELLDTSRHVLLKLLELGGDYLQELLLLEDLPRDEVGQNRDVHPIKSSLLRQTSATVRHVGKVGYFVNLKTLFGEQIDGVDAADAGGPKMLLRRLRLLRRLLQDETDILFFCTKECGRPTGEWLGHVAAQLELDADQRFSLQAATEECADESLAVVHWIAVMAGWQPARMHLYRTDHLHPGVGEEIDHKAVLRSLRRLLGCGDALTTTRSIRGLLAQQVGHLLLDEQIVVADKNCFAELLEEFDDSGYAELYRKVLHPMVIVPPMVLLDAFGDLMQTLEMRGIACSCDGDGQLPLEVEVLAEGVLRLFLRSTERGSTRNSSCDLKRKWRVLVQAGVVAEARRALNLFVLDGSPPPVSADAAAAILSEAWATAAQAWSSMKASEAFCELFLAARFLLKSQHSPLPSDCGFSVTEESDGDSGEPIVHLTVPQHVSAHSPWWSGNVFAAKRLRVRA